MKSHQFDLTQGNLFKNLTRLALPIMVSNFVQTLYNLTDAFWLGKVSSGAREAVAAVGISFPLVFFLQSFGFGFVVSGTALIAQYKGARRPEMMQRVIGQYVSVLLAVAAIFLACSFLLLDEILNLLHTPQEIFAPTRAYLQIVFPAQILMFIFICVQSFYHGVGDTLIPMKIQMLSVGINLILDPFLIFGIAFFPEMGVLGAAWTTFFARFLAAVLIIISLFKIHKELLPRLSDLIPDRELLTRIIKISIPASLGQSMTNLGFIVIQRYVNTYGTLVISTHILNNRIQSLFMMPAMGISNAISAVVGQNLGAGEIKRALDSVKVGMKLVLSIMVAGGLTVFFFGSIIISFFINDPEVIALGGRVMKLTCFTSILFSILFVYNGVFNGSGYTKATMNINVARLWLIRMPLFFLLSGMTGSFLGLVNIPFFATILKSFAYPLRNEPYFALWYSMLISNAVSAFWAYSIFQRGKWKKVKVIS